MEVRVYVNFYSLSGIGTAWVNTDISYPQYLSAYLLLQVYKNISAILFRLCRPSYSKGLKEKIGSGNRDKTQCEVYSK